MILEYLKLPLGLDRKYCGLHVTRTSQIILGILQHSNLEFAMATLTKRIKNNQPLV